jgi:hypothetical protein
LNENESRVGGRQPGLRLAPRGGGYQDICTASGPAFGSPPPGAAADDPRIAELRRVGLPRIWITAAQAIGYDAFMVLWRVLMSAGHVDDRCRVVVPNYARYVRYQRNQLIRQLVADGFDVDEIRERVAGATGETLTESHIRRAAARA